MKEVIKRDLLNNADLSELFLEFDDIPLGSARLVTVPKILPKNKLITSIIIIYSIAQVHKAKLLDGRVVAVKVKRPGIEGKLLGDIANLKTFAKILSDSLLIDYYKVFCEIEDTLSDELDFMREAQSTAKVNYSFHALNLLYNISSSIYRT